MRAVGRKKTKMTKSTEQAPPIQRLWNPVKRSTADSFLLVLMAAFGITVISVRVYLEFTGYPQVGDSTYHIAHLLWGGLLLFVALILIVLFANSWLLWLGAALGGAGMGLFIDEVGKFITQTNDYFFPLAFPIIYAFLLICVWLYLRVRRTQPTDARTLLYHALDDLKQVLDNDLDPFEHAELQATLQKALAVTDDPNEQQLALELRDFTHSRNVRLARTPTLLERTFDRIRFWMAAHPSREVLKAFLVIGFGWMVVQAAIKLTGLVTIARAAAGDPTLSAVVGELVIVSGKSRYVVNSPMLLIAQDAFIVVTGLLALAAAILLLLGRDRMALRLGTLALVIALTIVNLITFYFAQLYTVVDALAQLLLLGLAQWYRWRFLYNQPLPVDGNSRKKASP